MIAIPFVVILCALSFCESNASLNEKDNDDLMRIAEYLNNALEERDTNLDELMTEKKMMCPPMCLSKLIPSHEERDAKLDEDNDVLLNLARELNTALEERDTDLETLMTEKKMMCPPMCLSKLIPSHAERWTDPPSSRKWMPPPAERDAENAEVTDDLLYLARELNTALKEIDSDLETLMTEKKMMCPPMCLSKLIPSHAERDAELAEDIRRVGAACPPNCG